MSIFLSKPTYVMKKKKREITFQLRGKLYAKAIIVETRI